MKVGPLIDEPSREKVAELIEDALSKGATKVVGGEIPDGRGYFIEPTVLGDVPEDARVFREEIFGPVAPVGGFDSEEEAIERANDTEYGLVAYVFTRDIKRAIRVLRGARDRNGRPEPGHGLERRRPLRRREAERHRPRGRPRGPRGVPRDEVRRREPLKILRGSGWNFAGSRSSVASIRGPPEARCVPFNRVVAGGIALAVGCLLCFSAPAAAGPKVAAVQVALKRLGLYSATVDGVRGR